MSDDVRLMKNERSVVESSSSSKHFTKYVGLRTCAVRTYDILVEKAKDTTRPTSAGASYYYYHQLVHVFHVLTAAQFPVSACRRESSAHCTSYVVVESS